MNVLFEDFNETHPDQVDILAIPTNNFGLQEPGSNEEIPLGLKYVRPGGGFEAKYKLAEKNSANGADADPLFVWLKDACEGPQRVIGDPGSFYFTPISQDDITWNFEKFLVDQNGKPYKRYTPDAYPLAEMRNDILELLENGAPSEPEEVVEEVVIPEPVVVHEEKVQTKREPHNDTPRRRTIRRRPHRLHMSELKRSQFFQG